ncbi:NAD(P)/FAD-dependent oxidoreductase [Gymnodinialimonas sp.]
MIDVAIIGGSFAGLTAALQLGRASRSVVVVDAGAPRNRMSPAAHGVPGWDGALPSDILSRFRGDATAYPTVSVQIDTVTAAEKTGAGFTLRLASGATLDAHRVILAHGVKDMLPEIPGAAEAWGKSLIHCPYCHGYEVRHRPLAVLAVHPMSGHQAQMLRADWSDEVTLLTGTGAGIVPEDLPGIGVDARVIQTLQDAGDSVTVTFEDGSTATFAAIFTAPRVSLDDTPAAQLGCHLGDGPLGPFVEVGAMGQTSVTGVFAAGDCGGIAHSVTLALGQGAAAGTGCHQSLLFPDFVQPLEVADCDD